MLTHKHASDNFAFLGFAKSNREGCPIYTCTTAHATACETKISVCMVYLVYELHTLSVKKNIQSVNCPVNLMRCTLSGTCIQAVSKIDGPYETYQPSITNVSLFERMTVLQNYKAYQW